MSRGWFSSIARLNSFETILACIRTSTSVFLSIAFLLFRSVACFCFCLTANAGALVSRNGAASCLLPRFRRLKLPLPLQQESCTQEAYRATNQTGHSSQRSPLKSSKRRTKVHRQALAGLDLARLALARLALAGLALANLPQMA